MSEASNLSIVQNHPSLTRREHIRENREFTENYTLLNDNMREKLKSRNVIVDILSALFGIGSWIGVTAIFLQVPLLIDKTPEKWALPSYLVIMVQLGNVGPLCYTLLQKFSHRIKDSYIVYVVLIIGIIASLLMAFLYDKTAYIGDQEHSIPLLVSMFLMAIKACTSSVLFMPYMGRFKEFYLISYLIGEGLSGLLLSIIALIQGIGGNVECILRNTTNGSGYEPYTPPPRFNTTDFFIFVLFIILCSCIAFVLLDKLKIAKEQYAAVKITHGNHYEYIDEDSSTLQAEAKENVIVLTNTQYRMLLILMAMICLLGNGVLPSIQSYSSLPYGNIAYHLTVVLSAMASPIACFLALFLPHSSIRTIVILIGCNSILMSYVFVTALLSPHPPLMEYVWGQVLVVTCWTIFSGFFSYIKLCITSVMRSQGGKSLIWVGATSQGGSAIGSVITFYLINYVGIFKTYEPCKN